MEPRRSPPGGEQQYEMGLGADAGTDIALARPRPSRAPRAVPSAKAPRRRTRAVKAKPHMLPPEASAEEAFQLTLQQCKWHVLANIPAVVQAREIEGVHQLRVALRRLRVALASFGPDFRAPPIEALRMRAKILAGGLGPARDLDVFMEELLEPARAEHDGEAFLALRERGESLRRQGWEQALATASGLGFHAFLSELDAAIEQRLWRPAVVPVDGAAYFAPARQIADRELSRHLKKAKKRARNLERLSEAERHRLRIALKQLRYAAEFFSSLYPAPRVKPFAKRLAQLQDVFGLLQDVAVARATLHELIAEPPGSLFLPKSELCFAAGTVHGWHLERASFAWGEAKARWKRFAKVAPFWEIV